MRKPLIIIPREQVSLQHQPHQLQPIPLFSQKITELRPSVVLDYGSELGQIDFCLYLIVDLPLEEDLSIGQTGCDRYAREKITNWLRDSFFLLLGKNVQKNIVIELKFRKRFRESHRYAFIL